MALRVTSGGGCGAALLWAFAGGWMAMFIAFAIVFARGELAAGAWAAMAVCAAAGVVLLVLAIRASRNAARFRGASVDLETDPGVLGGKLAGVVHFHADEPLQLTLSNWRRDDSDELLWETTATTLDPSERFAFDVPFDCEPTSSTAYWRLLLESDGGAASFVVPVMQTAESSPAQTQQSLRKAAYEAPARTAVRIERSAGSTSVRFPLPSWIWRWYVLVLLLAAAGYLAGTFIYHAEMLAIVALGVIVLCAIPLPTFAMTVRRIDADRSGLTLRFLILRRPKRIAPVDVAARFANGALHYELTFGGATPAWTIINLRSRAEAEWVAYELRRAMR